MFLRLLRRIHVIELTTNIPPKLVLNLGNSPIEYQLDSKETISQLFDKIRKDEISNEDLKILINDTPVPETTVLGNILNNQFVLVSGKKRFHILPSRNFYIRGNETYNSICQECGIPANEARKISRYLFLLEKELPENFDSETFAKAVASVKSNSESFMQEEELVLKSQLDSYKTNLDTILSELKTYEVKARRYADFILKIGLTVLFAQWSAVGVGTFVLYGWDTMEPITYMIGSTWGILGFTFYMKNKKEFYPISFHEMLYNRKLEKLMKKRHFNKELIGMLEKKIELVEKQLKEIQ
ncbi:hypothetical protein SteCoe_24221 [Stentor coeruleus]|uniref:Calcium uniporter protein C-terminal domain-containing protein n=1 Tax=Stentor coeruleus TaxID=5963 RepID=A0A1R2BI32_9CILI|nr:hypothetical protein SteCoe_24221 [Stentor coeruleus]